MRASGAWGRGSAPTHRRPGLDTAEPDVPRGERDAPAIPLSQRSPLDRLQEIPGGPSRNIMVCLPTIRELLECSEACIWEGTQADYCSGEGERSLVPTTP